MKKEKKLFNVVRQLKEFEREFRKLLKKFKTLEKDMETFINVQLNLYHKLKISNSGIVRISDLSIESPKVYKVRKFACRSLKVTGGKSRNHFIHWARLFCYSLQKPCYIAYSYRFLQIKTENNML